MKWLSAIIFCIAITAISAAAQDAAKPKIAVFPLGGSSTQAQRDRIGFSIRTKLDRDGAYDVIDGPAMADMAAAAKEAIGAETSADVIKGLADGSGAVVLLWGDATGPDEAGAIRLRSLDLREPSSTASMYQAKIADATELRFAVEKFLAGLPGVTPFAHPDEEAVHHDPASDRLFASNPNLMVDGDFSQAGHWDAILESDKYSVAISDTPPDLDKVCIERTHEGNVLAMRMSRHCAESTGLACLSDAIEIRPGVRYRISFRYKSDGPATHVFVKGYSAGRDIAGKPADREVYRLQVPPGAATGDGWETVEADINPYNPAATVQRLRVDLYIYLKQGTVEFADVQIKAVGKESGATTQGARGY